MNGTSLPAKVAAVLFPIFARSEKGSAQRKVGNHDEDTGLTSEEIAFHDALADNQSADEILGSDQLELIAHELLQGLKANVSIDWAHCDSARLRVLVKRVWRKYGYPPDLEDTAVRAVLAQAEAILAETVR